MTAPVGLHVEFGAVEVNDDGTATVYAGTSVHGQGHATAFAMLASDVLGIPMDQINLVNSDTDRVPRGAGTMGSRSLQTAGSAIHVASNEVFSRAQKIAAHLLEASPDDIVAGEGGVHVAGVPANALSWADLASCVARCVEAAVGSRARAAAARARLRRERLDLPVRLTRVGRRGRHRDR